MPAIFVRPLITVWLEVRVLPGPPTMSIAYKRLPAGSLITAPIIALKDDLARRPFVRLQEQVDQKPFDGDRVVTDLMIALRFQPAQLQPVQRRLAGQRCTVLAPGSQPAGQHRIRIVAQVVVVIDILVPERASSLLMPTGVRQTLRLPSVECFRGASAAVSGCLASSAK
jgi:hypothetical protein